MMFTDPLTRCLLDESEPKNKTRSPESSNRNVSSDNLFDANTKCDPPPIPQRRRSSSTDRNLSNEKFLSPRRTLPTLLNSSSPANDILRRHEHRHKELLKMQDEKAQILSENKREEEERQWLQEKIADLQNRRSLVEKEIQQSSDNPSNERRLLQIDSEIDRLDKTLFSRFGSPNEIESRYRARCDKVIHLEKKMLQLLKGGEENIDNERLRSMGSSSVMSGSATEQQHVPASLCWSDHSSSPSHINASKLTSASRRFERGQLYQNFDPSSQIGNIAWASQSLTGVVETDNLSGFLLHPASANNLSRPHTAPCSQSNSFIASQNGSGPLLSDITPAATGGFIMSLSQDEASSSLLNALKGGGSFTTGQPTKRSTAIKELREANYSYPPPHLLPPSSQTPPFNRQVLSGKEAMDLSTSLDDMPSDAILEEHHAKVLDFLHQLQTYCAQMAGDLEMQENDEVLPGPAVAALMRLSFDEDYRQLISTLGGLETIADVLRVDYETFGHRIEQYQLTLRRHVCMTLTNLTFGVGANKSKLCSMEPALGALVAQLESPNEDLKQVAASVVRNLSWRAEPATKQALRSVDTPRILTKSLLSVNRESTLKSMLSALWNLSAHCAENKAEICAVPGALEFLVSTLTYKSPNKTLAIIENGGGILRNISSVVAVNEEYREILRERQCLPILLRHLRSPSLTIVSNACGTLWNLSFRCQQDQENLIDLGAVGMLRCLVNSKHKMISTGSAAALKNLLGVAHNVNAANYGANSSNQSSRRAHSAGDKPSLQARKLRALEEDVERILSESSTNANEGVISSGASSSHSNTGSPMLQQLIGSVDVTHTGSSDSVRTANSDPDRNQGSTPQSLSSSRLQQLTCINLSESSNNVTNAVYPLLNHTERLSSATSEDSIRHHNHEGDDDEEDDDGECGDFARTYCTEGTPHLSTAPSVNHLVSEMSDLSSALVSNHQVMQQAPSSIHQHQIGGPSSCPTKKSVYHQPPSENDYFSDSSEKPLDYSRRYKEQEDTSSTSTPPPLPPKKNQNTRTSVGVVLPMMRSKQIPMSTTHNVQQQAEKPRIYAVEGTPVNCQSRTSSLSSIFEVEEPASSSSDPNTSLSVPPHPRPSSNQSSSAPASVHRLKQKHQQLERIDERSGSESREVTSGASKVMKTVTFNEDPRVHVDMTPLVFSRCSSYSSLESFEAESVHSSVASDYSSSRRTSEVVSPSELPDSPGDTMPQSRNKSLPSSSSHVSESKNRRSKLEEHVQTRESESTIGQRSNIKLLSGVPVAHDETKYFADEGTPLDTNSRKNSMDALHFYSFSSTLNEIADANILIDRPSTPAADNGDSKNGGNSAESAQQRPISISTGSSRSSSGPSSDEDAFVDPQAILQQCINSAMPPPLHQSMKKSPSEPSGGLRLNVQPPPGPLPAMNSFKPVSATSCQSGIADSAVNGTDSTGNKCVPTSKPVAYTSQQSIAATNTPASSHRNSNSNTSSGSNRNSHSTSSSVGIPLPSDVLMTYAVEGTPLNYSTKASSLSELSIDGDHLGPHSPQNTYCKDISSVIENIQNRSTSDQTASKNAMDQVLVGKSTQDNTSDENRKSRATIDEESDTSSVNEECSELLSEVIQSAMPKRLPPSGSSGSAALSTRSSAPVSKLSNPVHDGDHSTTIIYPTLENVDTNRTKQQPPKPPIRTASLISSERITVDSSESSGNISSLTTHNDPKSVLPLGGPQTCRSTGTNSVTDAPYTYQTEDTPAQHSRNSPVSHSLVNSPPLSIHRRPLGASANEETSNRSSLSSLSIDSVGLEKTLLQECISSAMPAPKLHSRYSNQQTSPPAANSCQTSCKQPGSTVQSKLNTQKGSSRNKQGNKQPTSVLLNSLLALQQQQQQQKNKHNQRADLSVNKSTGHKITKSYSHQQSKSAPHHLPKNSQSPLSGSKNANLTNEELVNNLARQHVAKEIKDAETKTKLPSNNRSISQPTSPPLSANRKTRIPLNSATETNKVKHKETSVSIVVASTPPPLFPTHSSSVTKPMETRSTPVTPRLARANIVSPCTTSTLANNSISVNSNNPLPTSGKDKSRPSRSSSWFKSKNSLQNPHNQKSQEKSANESNYKMVRSFSQDKDMSSRLFGGFKRSPAVVPPDIGKSSSSLGADTNVNSSFIAQPSVGPPSVSSDAKTSSSTSFKKETGHFLDHCFGAGGLVPEAPKNDQKFLKLCSASTTSGRVTLSYSSDEDVPLSFTNISGVQLDEIDVEDSDESSLEIDCHAIAGEKESQLFNCFSSTSFNNDGDVLDDTDEETEWTVEEIEDKDDSGIILEEKSMKSILPTDPRAEIISGSFHSSVSNSSCSLLPRIPEEEQQQKPVSTENLSLLASDSFSLVSASLNSSMTDAQMDFTSDSAMPLSSESSGIQRSSNQEVNSEDSTMIQESMSSSCDSLIEDIPNLPLDEDSTPLSPDVNATPNSPPPLPMIKINLDEQTSAKPNDVSDLNEVKEDIVEPNVTSRRGPRIVRPNTTDSPKPVQPAPKIIRGGQKSAERKIRSKDHFFIWNGHSSSEESHLQTICTHQTVSNPIEVYQCSFSIDRSNSETTRSVFNETPNHKSTGETFVQCKTQSIQFQPKDYVNVESKFKVKWVAFLAVEKGTVPCLCC